MSRYFAIGRIVATNHPKMKKGQLLGLPLRKKWPDPYTVFYLVEEDGESRLAYVRLKWAEIKRFPTGLSDEEKLELGKKWLEEAIKRERNGILRWMVESADDELYNGGSVETIRDMST